MNDANKVKSDKPINRLGSEKSPYLLQHADNPVAWQPWAREAFDRARRENKPIFLSIGYSTCHWCHVMARESFEDDEIASVMNEHFVNVKLDREERPDLDAVYMAYVQATTGHGGWPMSVWLTPGLEPFVGGTYYPPSQFKAVLLRIAELWKTDRERILTTGHNVMAQLRQLTDVRPAEHSQVESNWLETGFRQFEDSFESQYGGFGHAPKFPRPSALSFLFRYHARSGRESACQMALFTLRKMAEGGMRDHIGGGFHRYSVDNEWHVPHFEKMLYDQAQLVWAYLEAYQITQDLVYADVARSVLDYVLRDLTGPEGQFYSAEDADSPLADDPQHHAEGAFYVWQHGEIVRLLGEKTASLFCDIYGVEPGGNVQSDPRGEFHNQNVLMVRHSIEDAANELGFTPDEARDILRNARAKLLAARSRRPRPHLDDKTLTAWNGLMISAFARAGQVLGDDRYWQAAQRAVVFIRRRLYNETTGRLMRRYRDGEAAVDGFCADYAFLIQGLLDLYEAGFDVNHLAWAVSLQEKQNELFGDASGGGYFTSSGHDPSVLLRIKDDYDGAEPSANSVSAGNLFRLSQMTGNPDYRRMSEKTVVAFRQRLERIPSAMPHMLSVVDALLAKPVMVVIAGPAGAVDTRLLLAAAHQRYVPNKIVLLADGGRGREFPNQRLPFLQTVRRVQDKATAYVCRDPVCLSPTTDPAVMIAQMTGGLAR